MMRVHEQASRGAWPGGKSMHEVQSTVGSLMAARRPGWGGAWGEARGRPPRVLPLTMVPPPALHRPAQTSAIIQRAMVVG